MLDLYRRAAGIPTTLPVSTAAVNRAVEWWNGGTLPDGQRRRRFSHVRPGDSLPEGFGEAARAFQAKFGRPTIGTYLTASLVNEIVEWWNQGAIDPPAEEDVIEIRLPDLARVALEPGDKILVRTPRLLPAMEAGHLRDYIGRHFPGHDVVVLPGDLELSVLRPRDDGSTSTETSLEI